jgi:hypothetical protein
MFIAKGALMSDKYEQITESSFREYLENDGYIFLTQAEIPRKIRKSVDACVQKMGELFLSEVRIITEELSPLAMVAVARVARKCGYSVDCTNENLELEYLGSDGGGHYSTDFYRFLSYGQIRVTLRQS